MKDWKIAWTQRMYGKAERIVETVKAANAALAIAEWSKKSWCNATIDAVWNPVQFDGRHTKGEGETKGGNDGSDKEAGAADRAAGEAA